MGEGTRVQNMGLTLVIYEGYYFLELMQIPVILKEIPFPRLLKAVGM